MQQLDIDQIVQGRYTWPACEPSARQQREAQLCGIADATRVRAADEGYYEIVGSPQAWLLAQRIQQHRIPVIDVSDLAVAELEALASKPDTQANVIARASEVASQLKHYKSKAAYGRAHNMTRSQVCNLVRIHHLPDAIKQTIARYPQRIGFGHAKVIAGLPSAQQGQLVREIVERRLSVRDTEQRGRELKQGIVASQTAASQKGADILRLEQRLGEHIGCPVEIDLEQGRLHIDYQQNMDVLQGVLERLGYGSD